MEKYRTTLPAGYREVDVIDIKNDKRVRVWGDILSVLLMAATAGVGCLVVPLSELIHFDYTDLAALLSVLLRLLAAGLGGVAVIVLTCLLAAAAMRWCGAEKTNFGITKGLVCTVGCDGYFSRGAYARYTLTAPAILFVVILLAALVLPRSWFWVAWFWQMNNISLMGMTLYMHRRLRRLPENIWIQDGGTVITVYAPQDIGEMNRE